MSYELSALANDAFNILNKAVRIDYDSGDFWEADDEHPEHPLVPRLRAASTMAKLTNPLPKMGAHEDPHATMLRNERVANDAMRQFLTQLEDLCEAKGMDRKAVQGWDVLKWLDDHVTAS